MTEGTKRVAHRLRWLAQCLNLMALDPSQQHPDQWRSLAITISHIADLCVPIDRPVSTALRQLTGRVRGLGAATPFRPASAEMIRHMAEALTASADALAQRPTPPSGGGQVVAA